MAPDGIPLSRAVFGTLSPREVSETLLGDRMFACGVRDDVKSKVPGRVELESLAEIAGLDVIDAWPLFVNCAFEGDATKEWSMFAPPLTACMRARSSAFR